MAIYNQIMESGINRTLMNRLNMTGDSPSPALMPELSAGIIVESDRPEYKRWLGQTPFSLYVNINAVVGEFGAAVIYGLARCVLVITAIESQSAGAVSVGWRTAAPAFSSSALSNGYGTDNTRPLANVLVQSGTNVTNQAFDNSDAALFSRLYANSSQQHQIVMWGDSTPRLLIRANAANEQVRLMVRGYFRNMTPNELG